MIRLRLQAAIILLLTLVFSTPSGPSKRDDSHALAFHRATGGAWQTWASNYAATIEPAGVSIPVGRHVFRMEIASARRQAESALTLRGELRFAQVRPGADVLYYGNAGGDLEFDFLLDAGADPGAIAMRWRG